MQIIFESISKSLLFKGLTPVQIQKLLEELPYQVKKFDKNELLALHGEECNSLVIIATGSVKGEMPDASGKVIKIEDIAAPGLLAPAFLFGQNNCYPVDITANEPVTIISIPRETLLRIFQTDVIVLRNFLNAISNRAQFLSNKIRFLSFRTIRGKIADYLLRNADNQGLVVLQKSQQELADSFGVARPSLARVLGEMQDEGIIRSDRRTVQLLNRTKLKLMLE